MKEYVRICPKCGKEIEYKTKKILQTAIKINKPCKSCVQSESKIGEKNHMFGKKHSIETIDKIKEKRKDQKFSNETRDKMSISSKLRLEEYNHWLGKKHKQESIDKMRVISANRIHDNKWHPSFNVNACKIIDEYGEKNGYDFQHALNGGEFFIKELGYWVDGYDKKNNVVIEYYEKAHEYFIEKDNVRINEIKNFLKCEIIILKENDIK
jgi:hypothetical protein